MRILLVIGAVLVLYWSIRILSKSSPQVAQKFLRNLVVAVVVVVFLLLLASGRLNWLGALLLAAIPFLARAGSWWRRLNPLWRQATGSSSGPSTARVSSVSSRFLIMRLDQNSGEIDGEIVAGRFQGRRLSQMSLDDLLSFNAEIAVDADSSALLQAYLDRIYPDWREKTSHTQASGFSDSEMTLAQALEILGLGENPSRDDVIKAHRRLMQKLHPDQGGSTYLAAKVNLAKQCVLDHLKNKV